MIELSEKPYFVEDWKNGTGNELYNVSVDGDLYEEDQVRARRNWTNIANTKGPSQSPERSDDIVFTAFTIDIDKPSTATKLMTQKWRDLPKMIEALEISENAFDWLNEKYETNISVRSMRPENEPTWFLTQASVKLLANPDEQIAGVNFLSYAKACSDRIYNSDASREERKAGSAYAMDVEMDPLSLQIRAYLPRGEDLAFIDDETIETTVNSVSEIYHALHRSVVEEVARRSQSETVSLRFDFPPAVKSPCEQYLMYFAQFLKDIGIEATTDIKHDAAGVLFTVTPENENVALDRIRQALAVYLKLPADPAIASAPIYTQPAEVQMLVANVQFLGSQLTMANALAQAQAVTIRSQEREIGRLAALPPLITVDVLIESIRAIVGRPDDNSIPLLGGMVKIKDADVPGLPGVSVDVPNILRRLRDVMFESVEPAKTAKELTKYEPLQVDEN